jgi:hypothetical protein
LLKALWWGATPFCQFRLPLLCRTVGWTTTTTTTTRSSTNSRAILLSNQGRLFEAKPLYRDALEGRRRVLGNDHPNTLTSMNNLAVLLKAQGKLSEVEPLYRDALWRAGAEFWVTITLTR